MKFIFTWLFILNFSACAPINTDFSCLDTASDRCLSMEAVNAMTEQELQNIASCVSCQREVSHAQIHR